MKKLILLLFVGALTFSSCSISKEVRAKRNLLSGSWTLNDVSFANSTGNFKAILFNDV